MAIRIPILTSFDPKGLKSANAAFANLQGSVRSLGSNFAALGVALAGAGALIAKNVQALARIETINAQTAQTIESMGNAANISATQVEALAGRLEALTATEAESIQTGANLLLTFRNISNQAGAGNDIFNQTTAIMVDMGRALREDAASSAIRLGKALNDPITGLTALRKVGVQFDDQQENTIRALQNSGDLMGAQKIILAELQAQFGGSGAAYAKTFSGQLDLMGHELGTIGEEATLAVMPALQGMIEQLRLLIPEIGPKLKAAIESVDWKALTTTIVDLTTFFIENIETIGKVVAAIFILNTAFKLMAVASGIATVAIKLQAWFTAQLTTSMTVATVATTILSAAMRLIPFVAIAGGIALVVTGIMNLGNEADKSTHDVRVLNGEITDAGNRAQRSAGQFEMTANGIKRINEEIAKAPRLTTVVPITQAEIDARLAGRNAGRPTSGISDLSSILAASGAAQAAADAQRIAAEAAAEAQRIADEAQRAAQEIAFANEQAAREAADALAEIERQAQAERDRAAAAEQAVLDKRADAYKSFADSVKQLFGQIKDNILSSFNLPTLGNSVNSITRNIGKLLEKTKGFANSISQLSGMGLNSALLQQVIQAGPLAGSRLASAIVGGGSAFISQLNSAYGEMGGLASGIAGVGTRSAFDNPTIANTYNIEVNGGVGSGPTIGKAIVDAIKSYERTSGAVWQGA
jgi:hypothetical protein